MTKAIIKNAVFLNLFLISCLFSCKQIELIEPVPPSENPSFLVGKWIEKEAEDVIQFAGSNHIIEFTEDQSFIEFRYWTDIIFTDDECRNSYIAYFTGASEIIGDSIRLFGKAANENFIYIDAECDQHAIFEKTYKYKMESNEVLILNPDEAIYNQIRLEKE